ncbi:hypothetical protein J6590_069814 [Homalodisca vitripennis]|nr:hypothetical protein J6590_069814 [Homalodisca vitripennis]
MSSKISKKTAFAKHKSRKCHRVIGRTSSSEMEQLLNVISYSGCELDNDVLSINSDSSLSVTADYQVVNVTPTYIFPRRSTVLFGYLIDEKHEILVLHDQDLLAELELEAEVEIASHDSDFVYHKISKETPCHSREKGISNDEIVCLYKKDFKDYTSFPVLQSDLLSVQQIKDSSSYKKNCGTAILLNSNDHQEFSKIKSPVRNQIVRRKSESIYKNKESRRRSITEAQQDVINNYTFDSKSANKYNIQRNSVKISNDDIDTIRVSALGTISKKKRKEEVPVQHANKIQLMGILSDHRIIGDVHLYMEDNLKMIIEKWF